MKKIDEKLEKVYNFTTEYINVNGFPPSVREICSKVGIKSTATAHLYLEKLKEKGLLVKTPQKNRAISLSTTNVTFQRIPLVGVISAGQPIYAVENLEGYIPLPDGFGSGSNEFALKVKGDSMINAGIYNNDIIIVKEQNTAENGEIVVALIEDEATVKRLILEDNRVILRPENDKMSDMIFDDVKILGIVKGLMRKF